MRETLSTFSKFTMSTISSLRAKLDQKEHLTAEEAKEAARALASEEISHEEKELFLIALAKKGETGGEIAAFAETFRGLARDPEVGEWANRAIDVCGTGGDKMGTFNISTAVAFVLAAGGVPVFKHGNRSITSKCGSAELLAALGVPMEADASLLQDSLRELNFAFFFAPAFHPAFKTIMPVRQALAKRGQRTIFNILGPLINPGRPACQLLGVFSADWMQVLASALDAMNLRNGFIAHCSLDDGRGMDELSCAGSNHIHGFGTSREWRETWERDRFGLRPADLDDLAGGDAACNLALFHRVLDNQAPAGLTHSILLNAGVGFFTVGAVASVEEGVALGRDLLEGGTVKKQVAQTVDFYRS